MSKIALEGNASGTGTFTIASPNSNSNYTLTLPTASGTVVTTGGAQTIEFAAGTAASPSITFTGDTNTGIFSPGADTIAFSEGGVESMRITSAGDVGIGTSSPTDTSLFTRALDLNGTSGAAYYARTNGSATNYTLFGNFGSDGYINNRGAGSLAFYNNNAERMRIDSSGNVGIGTTSPAYKLDVVSTSMRIASGTTGVGYVQYGNSSTATNNWHVGTEGDGTIRFYNGNFGSGTERARITSGGGFAMIKTDPNSLTTNGFSVDVISGNLNGVGICKNVGTWGTALWVNRLAAVGDGTLVEFATSGTSQGSISVSGATVSYNAFSGSHWSQFQQGRGYNPEILRGTVMSTIGEMCEWKSVVWDEVIEHPAVPAVEAKKAVLDEEGNIVEPAVEEVEGKDAWTETIQHRKSYLGQLPVGATFEEDGVTKTVVDDGNERLPKVKISDVVGDKAVYGVFQTYDDVQDMLVTSLGAFVVRIAAGVTVQIGDLLESNGDGCAKVQDDDVIRSRTIGKVTSTTPSATYADGSYTVPAVLYCG